MPRSRDNKGIFKKTPHPKTNSPLGADPLGKVEHTTSAGKFTIQTLEDEHQLAKTHTHREANSIGTRITEETSP